MITKLIASGLSNSPIINQDYTVNAARYEANKQCVTDDEVTALGVVRRYPYESLYTKVQVANLSAIEKGFIGSRHMAPPEGLEDFI